MGGRGAKTPGAKTGPPRVPANPDDYIVRAAMRAYHDTVKTSDYPTGGPTMYVLADYRDALARQGITDRGDQDMVIKIAQRAHKLETSTAIARHWLTEREFQSGIDFGDVTNHMIELYE